MKQFDKVWAVWLILVCIWNIGWPSVTPIADIIAAIIFSILAFQYKNHKQ